MRGWAVPSPEKQKSRCSPPSAFSIIVLNSTSLYTNLKSFPSSLFLTPNFALFEVVHAERRSCARETRLPFFAYLFFLFIFHDLSRARSSAVNDADNEHWTSTLPLVTLHEFLLVDLLLVHSLHMPRDMHLLLRLVDAMGTLKLGLLAALPLLMVPQATLQLVDPAAGRTIETFWVRRAGA